MQVIGTCESPCPVGQPAQLRLRVPRGWPRVWLVPLPAPGFPLLPRSPTRFECEVAVSELDAATWAVVVRRIRALRSPWLIGLGCEVDATDKADRRRVWPVCACRHAQIVPGHARTRDAS